MTNFSDPYPEQDTNDRPVDDEQVVRLLEMLRKGIESNEDDEDQKSLVTALQENRTFLLKYAMGQYLKSPKSASLLEGVTSLIAQMEKTVRDDRKERAKKKEGESNRATFNQLIEAMGKISDGSINMPVFDTSFFVLDPSKSLIDGLDIKPISEGELKQGQQTLNLEGEEV